jgi:hypothetical protein
MQVWPVRHCQGWAGYEGSPMDFDELLECYQRDFKAYRALIVLDDKILRRYVLCWNPHLVQRVHSFPMGESVKDLWDCVAVDYKALGELTGDSLPDVMARFRQVQGQQLIWPDGTVNGSVASILANKMAEITGL